MKTMFNTMFKKFDSLEFIRWKHKLLYGLLIFLFAFGVRFLMWQDQRFDAWKTQEYVAKDYRAQANLIREDGILSLLDSNARASSVDFMLHPPGYPIILAGAFGLFGDSDTTIQWISIIADSFSAVFIFLIVFELLTFSVAVVTGLLAAFSPQFSGNSILLLPDVLSILPLLIGFYFLIKAHRKPDLRSALICGIFIGLSCWIRANALLMAPFLAILSLFLLKSKKFSFPAALVLGTLLLIAPITIRNWINYKTFIPISLGTGQILLEGLGDYDTDKRFGMPKYDWDVTQQEAEMYNRPDYADNLVAVDGIKRDRLRTVRGLKFISEHPLWFASVMFRRAFWMLTPEKSQNVSINIPVSRSNNLNTGAEKVVSYSTNEIFQNGSLISSEAKTLFDTQSNVLKLQTDNQKYGKQFVSPDLLTTPNTEYVLRLHLVLREGRIRILINDIGSTNILNSTVVDPNPVTSEQFSRVVLVPFVSGENAIQFVIANEAPQTSFSVLEIQAVETAELGAARNGWTLPFRFPVFYLQKIYTLPVLLSLELIGFALLAWRREWKTLLLLFHIPLYYFFIQSALHTEYRYVMVIHYFLFALAAFAIVTISSSISERIKNVLLK